MKLHAYESYEEYLAVQRRATASKPRAVWVRRPDVEFLCDYLLSRVTPHFGLCHGSRTGKEQAWFAAGLGCEVVGTDLYDQGAPSTLVWDFHDVRPEWVDAVDFIYTNSLDHSYDPKRALDAWMSCTRLCLVEHTEWHDAAHTSEVDPFGADLELMPYLICRWGDGRYGVRQVLEHDGRSFLVVDRFE